MHVLVNQQTAMETGPVSGGWISEALPAKTVTVEQLRIDRHLDEALTRGPDPLHLSAVFGVSPETAMRYANAARHLLATQAEEPASQDGGGPRTRPRDSVLTACLFWTASRDQRQCSLSTVSFAVAIAVGPDRGSGQRPQGGD